MKNCESCGTEFEGDTCVCQVEEAAEGVAVVEEVKRKAKSNRMTEEELTQDYPHVVPGSLTFIETENKQAVKITCSSDDCERTREVRTSDLWQVDKCEACTRKARRERQRQRRKDKKAAAPEAEETHDDATPEIPEVTPEAETHGEEVQETPEILNDDIEILDDEEADLS